MKFGKLLQEVYHDTPDARIFLRYKQLKKQLKVLKAERQAGGVSRPQTASILEAPSASSAKLGASETASPSTGNRPAEDSGRVEGEQAGTTASSAMHLAEAVFVRTLNEDLIIFNNFFMDKEEECVIRLQQLSDQIATTTDEQQQHKLKLQLVELHGEMVLLLHWSLLNYAALLKILKKHDKWTGLLLKAPYQAKVLLQPFQSTKILSKLVRQAEFVLGKMGSLPEPEGLGSSVCPENTPHPMNSVMRETRTALDVWECMHTTASTPSTVMPARRAQAGGGPDYAPDAAVEGLAPDRAVHVS